MLFNIKQPCVITRLQQPNNVGIALTELAARIAKLVPRPDGSIKPEAMLNVRESFYYFSCRACHSVHDGHCDENSDGGCRRCGNT